MSSDGLFSVAGWWNRSSQTGLRAAWSFDGPEGLHRLSGPSTFTADDPDRFHADLTRVQLDHVALEAFTATPHRCDRVSDDAGHRTDSMLTFMLLAEGRCRIDLGDTAFDLQAGECIVEDSRNPFSMNAATTTRVLRCTVGIEHIAPHLQRRGTLIPGPLRRTPLVNSFIAFASTALRSTRSDEQTVDLLAGAVIDLQSAVLAEAQQDYTQHVGTAGLRYQMEEFIETHLTDPDLSPSSIATALDISLRHAHNVFNTADRTIARHIKQRRITAIALELRTTPRRPDLDELATRYGFPSAASMSRAFRELYDTPPTLYRATSHRNLGPPNAGP